MSSLNHIRLEMDARPENESFARMAAAAFVASFDPLVSDVVDIKTAVSEAVTNAVIHGYENAEGIIYIDMRLEEDMLSITVKDNGMGIEDIERAREPLYTSKPEMERSGMGFTVMETFMDEVRVVSEKGAGTAVTMKKRLARP